MKPLVMIGAGSGSLPRIVAEAMAARGTPLAGYLEFGDRPEPPTTPLVRLGAADRLEDTAFLGSFDFVVAVQGKARKELCERIAARGATQPVIAHPAATLSTTATVGAGTVISAGVIVQSDARIGRFCLLNTACTIDHDNVLGDFVSVSPGVHTTGHVTIGDHTFVGAGSVILNGLKVGRRVTIGAGAVVIRDVPDDVTVVGNPARALPAKAVAAT
jgi:sugar O-acyltransferase (sialic acid O-acetyltransferase NeuD family)